MVIKNTPLDIQTECIWLRDSDGGGGVQGRGVENRLKRWKMRRSAAGDLPRAAWAK